jgi:hypothetical protein
MDAQTADFFADRPDTTLERGPVHYYQDQDRTAIHIATASLTRHPMPSGWYWPESLRDHADQHISPSAAAGGHDAVFTASHGSEHEYGSKQPSLRLTI